MDHPRRFSQELMEGERSRLASSQYTKVLPRGRNVSEAERHCRSRQFDTEVHASGEVIKSSLRCLARRGDHLCTQCTAARCRVDAAGAFVADHAQNREANCVRPQAVALPCLNHLRMYQALIFISMTSADLKPRGRSITQVYECSHFVPLPTRHVTLPVQMPSCGLGWWRHGELNRMDTDART